MLSNAWSHGYLFMKILHHKHSMRHSAVLSSWWGNCGKESLDSFPQFPRRSSTHAHYVCICIRLPGHVILNILLVNIRFVMNYILLLDEGIVEKNQGTLFHNSPTSCWLSQHIQVSMFIHMWVIEDWIISEIINSSGGGITFQLFVYYGGGVIMEKCRFICSGCMAFSYPCTVVWGVYGLSGFILIPTYTIDISVGVVWLFVTPV